MTMACGRKRLWMYIVVWAVVVICVLLAPAPREWGALGKWISPRYDRVKHVIQPLAHIVFTGVLAVLISHHFSNRAIWKAALYSTFLAMVFSVVLELLQSILPLRFARMCDVEDLIPALIGALIGSIAGAMFSVRTIGDKNP